MTSVFKRLNSMMEDVDGVRRWIEHRSFRETRETGKPAESIAIDKNWPQPQEGLSTESLRPSPFAFHKLSTDSLRPSLFGLSQDVSTSTRKHESECIFVYDESTGKIALKDKDKYVRTTEMVDSTMFLRRSDIVAQAIWASKPYQTTNRGVTPTEDIEGEYQKRDLRKRKIECLDDLQVSNHKRNGSSENHASTFHPRLSANHASIFIAGSSTNFVAGSSTN